MLQRLCLFLCLTIAVNAQTVRFSTPLGDIDVILQQEVDLGPTVQNFLNYLNKGAYKNTIIHRSVFGFVIQGGGYQWVNNAPTAIAQDAPIRNAYKLSNTRGTIAMAKLGNDPHSATNQWFFNLTSGPSNLSLNTQNGGFTVFGRVANAEGLAVMDKIANVKTFDAGEPFNQIPLINYGGSGNATADNVVMINIRVLDAAPRISNVISAGAFGARTSAAPGSHIEIYGTNLGGTDKDRGWAGSDFVDGIAPTSIEGVTVTVDGKPAYLSYASPTQINAQIPVGVTVGASVPVAVKYDGQLSNGFNLSIRQRAPAILAPPSFQVEGKQYIAAVHNSTGAWVSNGSIPSLGNAPAEAGETLIFYGIGFGPVTPESVPVAGKIAEGQSAVVTPVEFKFGTVTGTNLYAGFLPTLVGVYQFNVTVPSGVPSGDVALNVAQGGESIGQTLWISMK